jgi:hypothetical protein
LMLASSSSAVGSRYFFLPSKPLRSGPDTVAGGGVVAVAAAMRSEAFSAIGRKERGEQPSLL